MNELLLLAEAQGRELKQARLELYLEDLSDLPVEPLVAALRTWRRQGSTYFPMISELRELVQPRSNEDAEAEHAWGELERWVKRYYHPDRGVRGAFNFDTRSYDQVPKLDERSERAIRAIGGPHPVWLNMDLGEGTNANYPFVKRDFIAAWKLVPAVEVVEARALATGTDGQKLLGEVEALGQAKKM